MPRTIEVPDGCKVVFVTDQLIEQMEAERGDDGWSPEATVQVHIPAADGLVIDPQFRYVATVEA